MVVGLALIAAYWMDLVARTSLVEIQTSLACPVMVAVMLGFVVYQLVGPDQTTAVATPPPVDINIPVLRMLVIVQAWK